MTAIKPIENRRVRGVPSERYPLGVSTSHPENNEEGTEAHHCFPRSQQIGDSWFVEITFDTKKEAEEQAALLGVKAFRALVAPEVKSWVIVIPHVVNLTADEHRRVETHESKILLEDGVWYWYDEITRADVEAMGEVYEQYGQKNSLWRKIGPLNPQPGSREGKPKKKRGPKQEKARARVNWQMRVPADELENGAGLMDDYVEMGRDLAIALGGSIDADTPPYHVVITVMAAGVVAMNADLKAQKAAEKAERARKRAEKTA